MYTEFNSQAIFGVNSDKIKESYYEFNLRFVPYNLAVIQSGVIPAFNSASWHTIFRFSNSVQMVPIRTR